jgi:hypothetical protein
MNINYEVGFWILIGLLIVGIFMIGKLFNIIRELSGQVEKLKACVDEVRYMAADINDNVNKVFGMTKLTKTMLEDICEDEDDYEDEEEEGPDDTQEIIVEIDEDPIHLITQNQYFFEKGHDKFDLRYYSDLGDLCFHFDPLDDSKFIVIDNVAECVGDALKFFGLDSKNDRVVYVRNNIFKADFMIERTDD